MIEEIFMVENPPLNRTIDFGGGTIQLGAQCVGAVLVWAKKVLRGDDINLTDPSNSESLNASVAARAQQGRQIQQLGAQQAQQDAFYTIRGGLTFTGLSLGIERYVHLQGHQILVSIATHAPSNKVYILVLREPVVNGRAPGHAVGVYKAAANSFYFFNPNTALYRCSSAQEFLVQANQELGAYLNGFGVGTSLHL
ncbi:hypothetical protein [Terriglobus saanensis]|uniref:Peptidase C58 YopT-type domain-containing protein n=1 Tax=Terriglobus saanensis (strain ATCC BAA-1853 / DSM 23119 / SP1PR4) TaxID=401053 RepID=E8V643_TERSS|nr:hypothetical protein [Terriglobus saanensis]ADV84934.1 hypothetical protein AciPR4_4189 [Terriglobus saanensis SP1PR4]